MSHNRIDLNGENISGKGPGSNQIRKGRAREEEERGGCLSRWLTREVFEGGRREGGVVEGVCRGRLLKGGCEGVCEWWLWREFAKGVVKAGCEGGLRRRGCEGGDEKMSCEGRHWVF